MLDKRNFDNLLIENKKAALAMLQDTNGKYLETIEIGGFEYKIFDTLDDYALDAIFEKDSEFLYDEGQHYAALFVSDVSYRSRKVGRSDFSHWYFCGAVEFNDSQFIGDVLFIETFFACSASFVGTIFSGRAEFSHATFTKTDFFATKFSSKTRGYMFRDTEFKKTEFIGETRFDESDFAGTVDFSEAKFTSKKKATSFRRVTFSGDVYFAPTQFNNVLFLNSVFDGNAYFTFANFYGTNTKFMGVTFNGIANFYRAWFDSDNSIIFSNVTFMISCNLLFKKFGKHIDFIGAEFRGDVSINWMELCEEKEKYAHLLSDKPKPDKILFSNDKNEEDILKSKDNLHAVKKMLHKIEDYEGEDHFYYWYKVYESKGKPFTRRTFNKCVLDWMTGYFTKPARVFVTIISVIALFCIFYCLIPILPYEWGGVKGSEGILWNGLSLCIKSLDNFLLFGEHLLKSLYFSVITFTTIGYGDYKPVGLLTMLLASFEGFIGVILMPTFLVTLAKKVLW